MSEQIIHGAKFGVGKGELVLPGDEIAVLVDSNEYGEGSDGAKKVTVRLGPGISQRKKEIYATKCGIVELDVKRGKVWVDMNQHRYVPSVDDVVIGVVQERYSEEYRVDLNGTDNATLSGLAFEGASKKNKPNLSIGSAVYCRVIRASKNVDTEVSCVEPGSARTWVGGETLFGELRGGNLIRVSLSLARSLVKNESMVLNKLGKHVAFQSAVGLNGRIWIQTGDVRQTMILSQALKKADSLEEREWIDFVEKLFAA